ncbi:MAG: archaeosortase A [Candidatus Syntropharchaeia archaeon]
MSSMIWVALGFFIVSWLLPHRTGKSLFGACGWIFFSIYWFSKPMYYLNLSPPDIFNSILTFFTAFFCLIIAFFMISSSPEVLLTLTKISAIACACYFPFSEIPALGNYLVFLTAKLVYILLSHMNYPALFLPPSHISLWGTPIQIVLACTAIESIALFMGIIFGVDASLGRKLLAFLTTVPVIYVLNLFRNALVIIACGYELFGPDTFFWAHHVYAKMGSIAALLILAYIILKILPEVLDMMEKLWNLLVRGNVE